MTFDWVHSSRFFLKELTFYSVYTGISDTPREQNFHKLLSLITIFLSILLHSQTKPIWSAEKKTHPKVENNKEII